MKKNQHHHQLMPLTRRRFLSSGGHFLWGLTLVSCAPGPDPNLEPEITLTISAAASLQTLFQTLQPVFQKQFPEIKLLFNFASSGALQRQIEQGAQVDVFIPASSRHMDDLEQQGLILAGTRRSLFQNRMALVTAKHIDFVKSFPDLLGDAVETMAIGQPESSPVGQYAQEILKSLELYQLLKSKLIYGKDARQILTYVTTGNAEVALVYSSDLTQTEQVNLVEIVGEELHSPIVYPGGAIADSPNQTAAVAFLDFLQGAIAQKQIAAQGFQIEAPKQR
ncbi:MAG: molybdate ABC transporter substrate-binding protein [Cyanobacteria bacterium P01_F01_bin.153]